MQNLGRPLRRWQLPRCIAEKDLILARQFPEPNLMATSAVYAVASGNRGDHGADHDLCRLREARLARLDYAHIPFPAFVFELDVLDGDRVGIGV